MKHIVATILLTLLALAPQEAAAAGCYSTNYQKAEELFRQGSYSAAIKRYRAAKACPDKPKSDNIDARISECNRRLNPPKPTYYLTVDGRSSVSTSFSSSGGSQWFSVSTNASSWSVVGAPSWCSVSRSSSGFTLSCESNASTSSRYGSTTVMAGDKRVHINISQESNPNNTRSAEIRSIWMEPDQWQDGKKGLLIHVKFDVKNMLNRDGRCVAYFYWDDDNEDSLKDTNNKYTDTGGNVICTADFRPSYKNSSYGDLQLFMPYKELHITTCGDYKLKFRIRLYDKSSGDCFAAEVIGRGLSIPSNSDEAAVLLRGLR